MRYLNPYKREKFPLGPFASSMPVLFHFRFIIPFLFFLMLNTSLSYAIDLRDIKIFENKTFNPNIHTIIFAPQGSEMELPVLNKEGQQHLILKFDDFAPKRKNYYYTIRHCDATWKESFLSPMDYIEGFESNPLNDYAPSFNTTIHYGNYQLSLPNQDIKFKLSGNYALIVYEDNDLSKVVFIRRFYVAEQNVSIEGLIKPAGINSAADQEFDLKVNHPTYPISDPLTEIRVVVMQNRRTDNSVIFTKPQHVTDNALIYEFNDANIFPGGNEFRFFDCKSLRFNSEGIAQISYIDHAFHVILLPSAIRANQPYAYSRELNGQYSIAVENKKDPDTEADYVYVDFSLPFAAPFSQGSLHVIGGFSDMQCNESNKMTYNFTAKRYEAGLLLKQGYYNYMYAFWPEGEVKYNTTNLEGSHFETENEYVAFVYHHPISSRYERLIGFQSFNTDHIKGIQMGW
ncbi:MAG: DUF5103 domain-containing protein [Bacteroidota bacterium]|nr:DUF5103 domain-containing protein [Bacteroidota bacterium]